MLSWQIGGVFKTKSELDTYLADKSITENYRNKVVEGVWVYYRCTEVPKRLANICPVRVKVFERASSTDYSVQYTTLNHDHKKLEFAPKSKQHVKDKIFELRSQYQMRPSKIRNFLKNEEEFKNEPTPSLRHIRYVIDTSIKTKIIPTLTFGELYEWCVVMQKVPSPSEVDQAFIIGHKQSEQEKSFVFVMSTLRMLNHACNRLIVVANGTYKLVWEDFPIMVVGTIDRLNKFHMLAICVTTNERQSDYAFVFETIKKAVSKHFNHEMQPKILISDAAAAIKNGFYSVFTSANQNVMCSVHVGRNVKDQKFKNASNYDLIKSDLHILQASPDKLTFDYAADLFMQKWKSSEPEFSDYFQRVWVNSNNTWFSGYTPFAPSHNNAQEGFNLVLKRDYTLRERLPFNVFKAVFTDMVCSISEQYSSHCGKKPKKIVDVPNISIEHYRHALTWIRDEKTKVVKIQSVDHVETFLTISSKFKEGVEDKPSSKEMKEFSTIGFEDFDQYAKNGFEMIYTIDIHNTEEWKTKSTCTCRCFQSDYMCKHILGMSLQLNLSKCPPEARTEPLPQKKARKGRISKAKKALQKQTD